MRQALRQSRKPERSRMKTAVSTLLVLVCALVVSGCASMGLSDVLFSEAKSSLEGPSTIRSQNSAASNEMQQNASNSVAADYSPLQASAPSTDLTTDGGVTGTGVVPVYASGHSFVQRRARLRKPIPLPDGDETHPAIVSKQPFDGNNSSQTPILQPAGRSVANKKIAASGQSPWLQPDVTSAADSVTKQAIGLSFNNAGWKGIPDNDAERGFVSNSAAARPVDSAAIDDGWNEESSQSSEQNAATGSERTTGQPSDESGIDSIPEEPQTASGTQATPDENSTDDAAAGSSTATAKEPTVLDRLRGRLYIPRREEAGLERSRKTTRRWTDPFGLLREREADTVDPALGATMPLPSESAAPGTELRETTEAAQSSEALLAPMIAQLEQELAQWPMLPNHKPRNEVDWLRRQTDLRMLYLIAGRSAESIRVIESLPEKEQEFWQAMMLAMESYRRSDDSTTRAEQLTETLEYVRTASRQLQPLSTMKIRRLNFCNRIDGFGVFSVFPNSDFNAGQPLLLYAEIENYKSEVTSDGQYRSEFSAMIEFLREGETEPITSRTIRLPEIQDLCSTERTDYFQSYELTIPSLSPGKYTLRLRIRDQLSLQTATTDLPFDIRPLGSQQ